MLLVRYIYYLFIFSKNKLISNGKKITFSYAAQAKLVQESLGTIRDLIINKSFDIYESNFKTDILKRNCLAYSFNFISVYPKIVIEGLGFDFCFNNYLFFKLFLIPINC